MKHLVVDVCVLMTGSGVGADDKTLIDACTELMQFMRDARDARLVVDDENLILNHYTAKCAPAIFGGAWVQEMANRGKISFVHRASLDRGTRTALKEKGFVGEDLEWYVRTAAADAQRRLCSHDRHFFGPAKRILLRRLGIDTCDPAAAAQLISPL